MALELQLPEDLLLNEYDKLRQFANSACPDNVCAAVPQTWLCAFGHSFATNQRGEAVLRCELCRQEMNMAAVLKFAQLASHSGKEQQTTMLRVFLAVLSTTHGKSCLARHRCEELCEAVTIVLSKQELNSCFCYLQDKLSRQPSQSFSSDFTAMCTSELAESHLQTVFFNETLRRIKLEMRKPALDFPDLKPDYAHVKLTYYVSSNGSSLSPKDLRREVPYQRERGESQESEAWKHRVAFDRWKSFADVNSKWKRSLQLAYLLTEQGFFLVRNANGNKKQDKIRCAFCKRAKSNWWPYVHPETLDSFQARASDAQVAAALHRWHVAKSPTCPRVLSLAVDAVQFTNEQLQQVQQVINTRILPQSNCKSLQLPIEHASDVCYYVPQLLLSEEIHSFCASRFSDRAITLDEEAALLASFAVEPFSTSNPYESHCSPLMFTSTESVNSIRLLADCLEQRNLKHWRFVSLKSRLASFSRNDEIKELLRDSELPVGDNEWPSSGKPSTRKLACAGFFATLHGDCVHCFCCGLSLAQLTQHSEPWLLHAAMQPDCAYVRLKKGSRFVQDVLLKVGSNQLVSDVYDPVAGFFSPLGYYVDSRDLRARPETPLLRSLIEHFQVPRELAKLAVQKVLKADGVLSNLRLLETLLDLETCMRECDMLNVAEFVQTCNLRYQQLRLSHAASATVRPTEQRVSDEDEVDSGETLDESAGEQMLCKVCYGSKVQVVFQCGHLVTCRSCAGKVDKCPLCRTTVLQRLRVYY